MNLDVLKAVILDQHRVIEKAEIVGRSSVSLFDDVNYIITGLRRAGKSTLQYQKVQDLVANGVSWNQIIYINFEDERLDGFRFRTSTTSFPSRPSSAMRKATSSSMRYRMWRVGRSSPGAWRTTRRRCASLVPMPSC